VQVCARGKKNPNDIQDLLFLIFQASVRCDSRLTKPQQNTGRHSAVIDTAPHGDAPPPNAEQPQHRLV
jgi:hypothetical protein